MDLTPSPAADARVYARWLQWSTRCGLLVMLAGLAAGFGGWIDFGVPPERLPQLWSLPLPAYLQATGAPIGWVAWMTLPQADGISLAGIALLASASLPALLALVRRFQAQRDRIYAVIGLAQVAVLLLAASGWLGGGA